MAPDLSTLAGRLRWLRDQAGVGVASQDLADAVGVHRSYPSQLEDPNSKIDKSGKGVAFRVYAGFARVYGVSVEWIATGEGDLPEPATVRDSAHQALTEASKRRAERREAERDEPPASTRTGSDDDSGESAA